jgi:carotenoid 1,2-hydratase
VKVEMQQPDAQWSGHAYLDSNEGDEPVDRAFSEWDWSRAVMGNGDTTVVYDVRPLQGPERVVAKRFAPDGQATAFEAPQRQALPRSRWMIARTQRCDAGKPPQLVQTLEDTPFYVRSVLQSDLLGERITSVHETLDVQRVASLPVRLMLPWRMPRTG